MKTDLNKSPDKNGNVKNYNQGSLPFNFDKSFSLELNDQVYKTFIMLG